MAQNQQWIELESCVYGYIDRAELSEQKFFKLWHLAVECMGELGLDFFYQIKSVKLPINSNLTVDLPADYRNYSKVGVLNGQGEIIPLKYNDKLTFYAGQSPDRIEKTQDDTLFNLFQFNAPIWYNYWNGNDFTTLYGLPSGAPFVGSFKIDNHAGIILLDEHFAYSYLMLEYIASLQEGQTYYVPIHFKQAIIAYLGWQDIQYTPSKTHVNNSNVQMRRREYYNQRRLGWARYRPFNLLEAYEWSLTNTRLTVKA